MSLSTDKINSQRILSGINQSVDMDIFDELSSTNDWLLALNEFDIPHVCITKHQLKGRGRRGREWLSKPGQCLCLSLRLKVHCRLEQLKGFSLVVALALRDVLQPVLESDITLKWPNDILVEGKKLCGILIETTSVRSHAVDTVIGIGINILPVDNPDFEAISLTEITNACDLPDINELISDICNKVLTDAEIFEQSYFSAFHGQRLDQDNWIGKEVNIYQGENVHSGIYQSVDCQGQLIIKQGIETKTFLAGEVSLRAQ